jgi:hypothetical protein
VRVFLLITVVLCGCSPTPRIDATILGECFVEAAYQGWRAERLAVAEEPEKCCGTCGRNGLPRGRVLSGDGLAVVRCPCPDSCNCKASP